MYLTPHSGWKLISDRRLRLDRASHSLAGKHAIVMRDEVWKVRRRRAKGRVEPPEEQEEMNISDRVALDRPFSPSKATIGDQITLTHAWLDNAFRMTVMDLAAVTKEEALDSTARQGSRELRERVRKLGKMRLGKGPALVKLGAILSRAERVTERRNHLLHSVWGRDLDGEGNFLREPEHSFEPAPKTEELSEVSEDILKLVYDMIEARLEGFLHAALKKQALTKP